MLLVIVCMWKVSENGSATEDMDLCDSHCLLERELKHVKFIESLYVSVHRM
jgi:hypothetical protein